jgi:hypothetical protein
MDHNTNCDTNEGVIPVFIQLGDDTGSDDAVDIRTQSGTIRIKRIGYVNITVVTNNGSRALNIYYKFADR